jgi:hypothetical protein
LAIKRFGNWKRKHKSLREFEKKMIEIKRVDRKESDEAKHWILKWAVAKEEEGRFQRFQTMRLTSVREPLKQTKCD